MSANTHNDCILMNEHYEQKAIEKKWQQIWEQNKTFEVSENSTRQKFYCLSMFAYPSGKLHMGHVRNYTISDVIARFYRLNNYNVMHPFGWDAFGLPAENAALAYNISPTKWTYENIAYMKAQVKSIGLAVSWEREFATCDPEYYKWQQWLFIKLYERGIIYRENGVVNWDPVDNTVLANEQVIDGRGWRSGALIERRTVPMYYFKITAYAEELLQELDTLDSWPEQVKLMQKNWIGKSVGLEIDFLLEKSLIGDASIEESNSESKKITVFTTRADTLAGVTFLALAPTHPLVSHILQYLHNNIDTNNHSSSNDSNNYDAIKDFIELCKLGGVSESSIATQEKVGIFTGLYATNPLTTELIPIWICNYVLANYATGAIMGVPAHCQRDFEFAKKYKLPLKIVLSNPTTADIQNSDLLTNAIYDEIIPSTVIINSGILNNKNYEEAITLLSDTLVKDGLAKLKINYRLRNWGISRQRYWGCPIPIIHCDNCGDVLEKIENLPIKLPQDVVPDGKSSILSKMPEFYETKCPNCGMLAKREVDTMDTFVDSSWYYLRFTDSKNHANIFDQSNASYWSPVDQYVGGIEHAILHLLYARFFNKCMRDLGLIKYNEPFKNLLTQGMVLSDTFYMLNDDKKTWVNFNDVALSKDELGNIVGGISKIDGKTVFYAGMEKMSKSKNNGVDPNEIIAKYGADTARLFMMFSAPPELSLEWSPNGIEGANRFMRRLWNIVYKHIIETKETTIVAYNKAFSKLDNKPQLADEYAMLRTMLHQTIKKVTQDIAVKHQFNTAIASIMELLNFYNKLAFYDSLTQSVAQEVLESCLIMLYPIIPHITSELWTFLHKADTNILNQAWVAYDELALEQSKIEIIIQINGKLRGKLLINKDMSKAEIEALAIENHNVQKFLAGNSIKKIIIVPNKIINIVV